MIKVSIVVPVHNVEKYLEKCLNSIVNQTFKDIEIILVDDGSTDSSLDICYSFAENDNRIIIRHNEGLGVSEARNIGIKLATGEYIVFVDSDDWLELNMIEKMYKIAKDSNSEIILCSTYVNTENNEYINEFYSKEYIFKDSDKVILQRQAISDMKGEYIPKYMACGVPWAKIYKTSFLKDNNLMYDKRLPRMQDMIFNLYAFEYANSIQYISIPLYHYRKNNLSVCNVYDKNMIDKYTNMLIALKEFMDNTSKSKEEIKEAYNLKTLATLNTYIDQLLRRNPKFSNNEIKEKINDYLDKYYDNIKEIKVEYLTLISKIKRELIVNNKITLLILLFRIIEKKYEIMRKKNYK